MMNRIGYAPAMQRTLPSYSMRIRTVCGHGASGAHQLRCAVPATAGPAPVRVTVNPGGPLDGLLLDIHGWRTEEVDDGVALSAELSRWPGGRALYDPAPGEPRTPGPGVMCRFYYSGDTPDHRPDHGGRHPDHDPDHGRSACWRTVSPARAPGAEQTGYGPPEADCSSTLGAATGSDDAVCPGPIGSRHRRTFPEMPWTMTPMSRRSTCSAARSISRARP
ncbi:hypothetical protein [Streptomyces prunicolor]